MEFWIRVADGRIADATYVTDGCWPSVASGYAAACLAKDLRVGDAQRIEQQHVMAVLGGLPEESQHCALLAANTLRAAIEDYRKAGADG